MDNRRLDDTARRAYWSAQMDAAAGFMDRMNCYPVQECGEPLLSLPEAVREAGLSVVFAQTRLAGCHKRLFFLRAGLMPSFMACAAEMNDRGWTLKVEDGFRSRAMQRTIALHENVLDFVLRKVIWELGGERPTPEFLFRRMTALTATWPKIGTHMSGSAIDISVLRAGDGVEIDRGGPYIEISELTPMASPFVPETARRNRAEISAILLRHGFQAYPYEFWHYSQGDAYAEFLADSGRPARYGAVDFDPATGRGTPIPNPTEPLHSMEDIHRHMESAMRRLDGGKPTARRGGRKRVGSFGGTG